MDQLNNQHKIDYTLAMGWWTMSGRWQFLYNQAFNGAAGFLPLDLKTWRSGYHFKHAGTPHKRSQHETGHAPSVEHTLMLVHFSITLSRRVPKEAAVIKGMISVSHSLSVKSAVSCHWDTPDKRTVSCERVWGRQQFQYGWLNTKIWYTRPVSITRQYI